MDIQKILVSQINPAPYNPRKDLGPGDLDYEKLGRRCYMMEISEMYCDVIITRWQNFTGKEAVKIDNNTTP